MCWRRVQNQLRHSRSFGAGNPHRHNSRTNARDAGRGHNRLQGPRRPRSAVNSHAPSGNKTERPARRARGHAPQGKHYTARQQSTKLCPSTARVAQQLWREGGRGRAGRASRWRALAGGGAHSNTAKRPRAKVQLSGGGGEWPSCGMMPSRWSGSQLGLVGSFGGSPGQLRPLVVPWQLPEALRRLASQPRRVAVAVLSGLISTTVPGSCPPTCPPS